MLGFVDLGIINYKLLASEREIKNSNKLQRLGGCLQNSSLHMSNLQSLVNSYIHPLLWDVIHPLEFTRFNVVHPSVVTRLPQTENCSGYIKTHHLLVVMHVYHKTVRLFFLKIDQDFFMDVPHLTKTAGQTTRTFGHSNKRYLQSSTYQVIAYAVG